MIVIFFGFVSRSINHSKETLSPVNALSDEFHKKSVTTSVLSPQ